MINLKHITSSKPITVQSDNSVVENTEKRMISLKNIVKQDISNEKVTSVSNDKVVKTSTEKPKRIINLKKILQKSADETNQDKNHSDSENIELHLENDENDDEVKRIRPNAQFLSRYVKSRERLNGPVKEHEVEEPTELISTLYKSSKFLKCELLLF
jgi:hypothetical protein